MSDQETRENEERELLERFDHPDCIKLHESGREAREKAATKEPERVLTPYERNFRILNEHHSRLLTDVIENEVEFREKVKEFRLAYLEEKLSISDIPEHHRDTFREIVGRRVENHPDVKSLQSSFARDVLADFDSIHGKYESSMAEGGKADQTRKLYERFPSSPRSALFDIEGIGFYDDAGDPEGIAELEGDK